MSSLTYKDSGVDITKGSKLIEKIKPIAKSTSRPGVLAGLGGFGAIFETVSYTHLTLPTKA